MAGLGLLIVMLEIAVIVFVLTLAVRLVKAVEGIERSVARAVAHYERSSP